MVLLHLGTDDPIALVHNCSYWIRTQMVPSLIRHRWSWCIWAQMVSLHSYIQVPMGTRQKWPHAVGHRGSLSFLGTDGPVAFGHRWSHCIRAYMFLLDPGTDGPFRNQAQMVLVHLGTDGPIAFVHTSSYGHQTQMAPFSRAQMVLLHLGTDGPISLGHSWCLFYSGTDSPIVFGHR